MFKLKNLPLAISLIVVISLVVGWGISMVLAWTNPGAIPPSGNVAAPINIGSTGQSKAGDLNVFNLGARGVNLNNGVSEGNIGAINQLNGYNDIFIRGNSTETAPVYLAGSQVSAYTGGGERLRITAGGIYALSGISTYDATVAAGTIEVSQLCLGNGANCISSWPGGSGFTGSGTANYVAKFTGSTSLGNSTITDDGTTATHTGAARFIGYGTDSWFPYVNGVNYLRGNLYFNGVLYDENNPGYYVDPNGTSRLNAVTPNIIALTTGDSPNPGYSHYAIYEQPGTWTYPYPDLMIEYHTGISYIAYYGYGGHRFYTGYSPDASPTTLAFSVGEFDNNTRVYGNLYVSGTAYANGQALCQANGTNCPTGSTNADTVDLLHASSFRQFNTWQNSHYSGTDGAEYATIYYDTNNSGYYVDPNATSRINYGVFDNIYSYGWMQTAGYIYSGSHLVQNNYAYIFPGRVDGGGAWQTSWYLASYGAYGLYTNTGLYAAGTVYSNGSPVCQANGTNCPSLADGNNYTTGASFSGTTTKTLTLTRNGLANLTASFTDIDTDTNNYPTAISFSGTTTKTLTLSRNGLSALTATFTDNGGIAEEADTLDTVCDRGNTTDRTINTSGGVIAGGEVRAGGGAAKMQSDGTIQAGSLSVAGVATVGGTLTVNNALQAGSWLSVAGTATVGGTLTVNNTLVTSGNLVANQNSHGACLWLSTGTSGQIKQCPQGWYMAGGSVDEARDVFSIYCCQL